MDAANAKEDNAKVEATALVELFTALTKDNHRKLEMWEHLMPIIGDDIAAYTKCAEDCDGSCEGTCEDATYYDDDDDENNPDRKYYASRDEAFASVLVEKCEEIIDGFPIIADDMNTARTLSHFYYTARSMQ
jgi:hypothetical protein